MDDRWMDDGWMMDGRRMDDRWMDDWLTERKDSGMKNTSRTARTYIGL